MLPAHLSLSVYMIKPDTCIRTGIIESGGPLPLI